MTDERPTEPTQPPAYTPPTYAPPPPIAPPEPAVAWAPPAPPSAAAPGRRTALSLGAGILLVVLGLLGLLFSLALLTIGREVVRQFDFSGIPGYTGNDPNGYVGSVIAFVGIFVLVCSTFYIVGGVGIIRSANWARVIGIVVGIAAGLWWLLVLVAGRGGRSDISFVLVLVALHAYIAIALLFSWRSRSPA
jgi:hypothetical protein